MDSDGLYNVDTPRNKTDHVELEDGQWHMVTVTTNPKTKGYRIYIDGQLGGSTPDVDGEYFVGMTMNLFHETCLLLASDLVVCNVNYKRIQSKCESYPSVVLHHEGHRS